MLSSPPILPASPGIRYFLPLLYIAWSDEVLTPTEVELLDDLIQQQDWLAKEEKEVLHGWLDPQNAPSPATLQEWLRMIRQSREKLPGDHCSLLELCNQVADIGSEDDTDRFKNPSAAHAIRQIEAVLGIGCDEAVRDIMAAGHLPPVIKPSESVAPFSIQHLQNVLDGDHADLKNQVRNLLSDPVFSYERISPVKEEYREVVLEWLQHLADRGYGALSYPESVGGKDNMGEYIAVFEILGHYDLSLLVKFGVQFGLFGGSILGLGTERHHQAYLPGAGSLAIPGCFAMTESLHGSNVRDLETTATFDPSTDEFIIHTPSDRAFKEYIGNAAAHARLATVFAQLETNGEQHGVHAFVVPIRDAKGQAMPGVRIGDSGQKLGLNGVDNGRLWFEQVRIPRENLLDRFAQVAADGSYHSPIASAGKRFFTMLGTLVGGRVCVPLGGLSAAKNGITTAIRYGNIRRQFGPTGEAEVQILDYPTHQRRLLPLLAKIYALHFAHRYMVDRFLTKGKGDEREIEALAAGLKAVSTWHTTKVLQECREACGGNGYLAVNRLADMKADTEIFTTFEGDNTVLLQLVAKGRLSEFKREFSSMKFWGMVNFVGNRIGTEIRSRNPFATRAASEEHLRDSQFHLHAFTYREEDMVRSAARRFKHRLDQGMDSYQAMMEVQTHLVEMAEAYIDRVILEQFISAVEHERDESTQKVLKQLCDLYALSAMEANKGWYLEQGFFEAAKSLAIRKQVDQLCAELRPVAGHLVDAFGIPDHLLGAPIAR